MEETTYQELQERREKFEKSLGSESEVYNVDGLASICGFFCGLTNVNNGYGCNHVDCDETELTDLATLESRYDYFEFERIRWKITLAVLRKKFGSWHNSFYWVTDKDWKAKPHAEVEIKNVWDNFYSNEFLKPFGYVMIGKCYSFSCPLGNRPDEEDGYDEEDDCLVIHKSALKSKNNPKNYILSKKELERIENV